MRTMPLKVALVVLLIIVLASTWSALAWSPEQGVDAPPPGSDSAPAGEQALSSGSQPMWISGGNPGFYAARDNRNLDPTEYNLVGGHNSFYWGGGHQPLEEAEGVYNWHIIDNFINGQTAMGKKAAFGILTFAGRANTGDPIDPPVRVPQYVFDKGAGKVICPDGFEIPEFWDATYKAEYEDFITDLAARYDGDSRIEFIQIGVGKFGETQPCDDMDNPHVEAAMLADGYTQWSWPYIVNDITDIYARHFSQTKLLLPNAPRFMNECDRREFTDHAVAQGVGLFPAGIYPELEWVDLRTKPGWNGCGKYDRILDQAGTDAPWVPLAFEMYHYMTPDSISFFWGVAAGLSRHTDYITAERDVLYEGQPGDPVVTPLYDNIATIGWANQYMGKHTYDTPSVWVLLRESGYADNFLPQKGNYSWWLEQEDISGGETVLATYRTRRELVRAGDYDYYGDSCVRTTIETEQAFLGPSREGWICRRTTNGGKMYFKIDDRYFSGGPSEATVTITYLDRGWDSWDLICHDGGGSPISVRTVNKTNTGTWREEVVYLPNAWFNNMLGGYDFYIDSKADGGEEYIHKVDVNAGAPGVTPTPTNTLEPSVSPTITHTPTNTPTPTRTSTPTNTPTPTITPETTPTPATVYFSASKDTSLATWYPDTNYGGDHRLWVGRQGLYRSLLAFDLSGIPSDATVHVAKLGLYVDYLTDMSELRPVVSAYKVRKDWAETQATWNERLNGVPWAGAGCDDAADRDLIVGGSGVIGAPMTWNELDVQPLVQDWVWHPGENRGMLLFSTTDISRWLRFHSADYPSEPPYLYVEYTGGGGGGPTYTPTPTLSPTPEGTPGEVHSEVLRGASQDTYLDFGEATEPHENRGIRVRGWSPYRRGLLNFYVGHIPSGAEVLSAQLVLTASEHDYGSTSHPFNIGAYLVNHNWFANQATWLSASTGNDWLAEGCDNVDADRAGVPSDTTFVQDISGGHPWDIKTYSWDVTGIVQAWIDDMGDPAGLILISEDPASGGIGFHDSGHRDEYMRPVLYVNWYIPEPSATKTPTPTETPVNGAVAGVVYYDHPPPNGIRDAGEEGVPGAIVELWRAGVREGYRTTPGSGSYSFSDLEPGQVYTVKLVLPSGYQPSTSTAEMVIGVAGQTTTVNFGIYGGNAYYMPLVLK